MLEVVTALRAADLNDAADNIAVLEDSAPTAAAAAAADGRIGPDGVPSSGDEASGYTDSIDGTLTLNSRRALPDTSGSTITVVAPTVSMGAISGS